MFQKVEGREIHSTHLISISVPGPNVGLCFSVVCHESSDVKLLCGLVVGDTTLTSLIVPSRAEGSDAVAVKSVRFTAAVYCTPACTRVILLQVWRSVIVRRRFP